MPNKYLSNLALFLLTQKARELNLDISGSHLRKLPRKQVYQLIKDETDLPIIQITFYPNQTPTYYIQPNN